MDYRNKYKKYKKLYLDLKNNKQFGGTICNLSDWTEISNNGQNNCGIFIHKTDPKIIMKCGAKLSKDVKIINSQKQIFPEEYSECTDDKNNTHLIMERLDNDITSIYFNLLPLNVLQEMNLNKQTISDMKMIFDIKTNTTIKPIIPQNAQENILATISATNKNITLELYDTFIDKLIIEWNIYHPIIIKEIIKVLLKLSELEFKYSDMKFDNFAYKLSDTIIDTDYRRENVPKIFGKYFYVYILDPSSGLANLISEYETFNNYFRDNKIDFRDGSSNDTLIKLNQQFNLDKLKKIYEEYVINKNKSEYISNLISDFNRGFNLSVHGQYSISNVNGKYKRKWNDVLKDYEEYPSWFSSEIIKILDKEYIWQLQTYNCKNIEELSDIINKIKCNSCGKLLQLDCKYCCNCGIKLLS